MPHNPEHAHRPNNADQPGRRDASSADSPQPVPLSVWACAQRPAVWQRRGRYLPATTAHPAKMLPALAATAIISYTAPGELVLDPMCGIGTSLVEAIHLDRNAIGIECEPRWANLARANLDHAREHGATGTGAVVTGDARGAHALITDTHVAGQVALLVTSPPYGQATHGQVRSSRDDGRPGVRKWDHGYGKNPHNLARGSHERLLSGFTAVRDHESRAAPSR